VDPLCVFQSVSGARNASTQLIRAPRPHWLAIPELFCRALHFAHKA
jgi:hypothetical protein